MPDDILSHLRAFTARERISLPPAVAAVPEMAAYEPVERYLSELASGSKPERAAEDLFVALARDVARLKSIPQVNIGEGFVDFIIGGEEHGGGDIVIELKPLFTKYSASELRRGTLTAPGHLAQIKKYLTKREYVVVSVGGSLLVPDGIDTQFLSSFRELILQKVSEPVSGRSLGLGADR